MSIKLVAIDIDSTLITSKRQLTSKTIATLKKATAQGVKVVIATGRPFRATKPLLDELGLAGADQYVITYNGSVVLSLDGQVLVSHTLSKADFAAIDAFCTQHHVAYNLRDDQSRVLTPNRDIDFYIVHQAWDSQVGILHRTVADVPADFRFVKAMMVGDGSFLDTIEPLAQKTFGDRFYMVRSTPNLLECLTAGVDKGTGIANLAEKLGITPTEVMVLGDERNDLPMFRYAGLGVAMGNAHPAVKQIADAVTLDNDHDGVAAAVEKFVLK